MREFPSGNGGEGGGGFGPLPSAAREDDALASVREATAHLHADIDARLPIGGGQAKLADYRAHLRMLHCWLGMLAPLRAQAQSPCLRRWLEDITAKRELINSDLAEMFGADEPADDGAAALPDEARAQAFLWGAAYVVEGSQLGGRMLYQRLKLRLSPHPLRYLRGRGEETSATWRRFIADFGRQVRGENARAEAIAGATHAFALLHPLIARL
ncbi:MAG: heme oxygenase [Betaproteobacteria bacterium]|nr:heme oxygenase [Betaproteobacteria bacterium]